MKTFLHNCCLAGSFSRVQKDSGIGIWRKALLSSHRLSLWSLSLPRSEANCLAAQTFMRREQVPPLSPVALWNSNASVDVQGHSCPGPASSHLPQNHWFCSAHLSHCFRPQRKANRYGFSPRLQRAWLMHASNGPPVLPSSLRCLHQHQKPLKELHCHCIAKGTKKKARLPSP